MLIGATVTILIAFIGVGVFAFQQYNASHAAAAVNMNCTLIIPPDPLTPKALATPYQLTATNPANGPCNEANANQAAFVMADIIDPATGQITNYNPLVIDKGTQPAIAPTAPNLPANAVVGIWFGFNGTVLTLKNNAQTGGKGTAQRMQMQLAMQGGANGNCVNGVQNSPFGQFGYCNAPAFFQAANQAIQNGQLKVPALGTAKDGQPCPTTRDFSMVDMDQSDNVQTQYLANGNGQTAQLTAANQAQLPNATVLGNPSDNALLTKFIDPALGCTPWTVPDLANNNNPIATYGTDELMAAADQQAPIALVPGGDPMVLNNNNMDINKVNAYRAGADQPPAAALNGNAATDANTTTYCQNLVNVALPRLQLDMNLFQNQPSPDNGVTATTLFGFLANRLNNTFSANGLNCVGLLKIQNPVTLTTNGNGVVTSATITTKPLPANANANANAAACATATAAAAMNKGTNGMGTGTGTNGMGTGTGTGTNGMGTGTGTGTNGMGTGTGTGTNGMGTGTGTGTNGMGTGTNGTGKHHHANV
jgi:hypothetical protein